jgi:hypothetical protein
MQVEDHGSVSENGVGGCISQIGQVEPTSW